MSDSFAFEQGEDSWDFPQVAPAKVLARENGEVIGTNGEHIVGKAARTNTRIEFKQR
jgi:hypothetical protein